MSMENKTKFQKFLDIIATTGYILFALFIASCTGFILYHEITTPHTEKMPYKLEQACKAKGEYYYDAWSEACKPGFKP